MNVIPHDYGFNFVRCPNPIVNLFAEKCNFTVRWVRVDNWGYLLEDNVTFSGAVGMMQRREINMTSATMIYMPTRAKYIDSGLEGPILVRQRFVFRHPHSGRGVSSMQNAFLRPLEQPVWASIAFTTIIGVLTFIILLRHERKLIDLEGLSSVLLSIIGILAQQGFSEQIRTSHFKLVVLTFLILSFFLLQFYSASIVGTLLTPFPKTIKTVKGLTNSDLKVILEDVPSATQIVRFQSPELYERKKLADKRLKKYSIPLGLEQVRKGGSAFFVYIDQAREIIKRNFTPSEIDDLQEVDYVDQNFLLLTYFAVLKFSPCKEVIRVANRRVIEVGLSEYWNTRYVSSRPFGTDSQLQIADVTLGRISTLIFLLFYGFVASFVILLIEILFARKKNSSF